MPPTWGALLGKEKRRSVGLTKAYLAPSLTRLNRGPTPLLMYTRVNSTLAGIMVSSLPGEGSLPVG